jgi:FtsH-binding integral membrane protein
LVVDLGEIIVLASLTTSLVLLLLLIYRHVNADVPRLASTKTWLALAIIIWISGEIVSIMGGSSIVYRTIHTISMIMFPVIIVVKARKLFKRRP